MNKRFTSLMTTLILSVFFSISASAYDVEVDGIYYNINKKVKTAEVTHNGNGSYSGAVAIPETITIEYEVYNVTSIGGGAFFLCSSLKSVTIPNSVTSIGVEAFRCCDLSSISIPNSITEIGGLVFESCHSLTSITIPNSVISIGNAAFQNCWSLTSITIPNSVTSIGSSAFQGCSNLTSITIPNSLTSIGSDTFHGCTSLASITIPNSVTSIYPWAFYGCTSLTSITIPNSVTSIGDWAFYNCTSLTSISIPNSVTDICYEAFAGCKNLANVYCYAETVPSTQTTTFKDSYIEYATLHVPTSAINAYKTTEPWSGFGKFKTLEGAEVETKKCETPTISFVNGELVYNCATEGVEFVSEIKSNDINKFYTDKVSLSACYDISVTAMKTGYDNSDVATAKLYWLPSSGTLEGDNINNVAMRGIAIQSAGGFINISGLDNNEKVDFYGVDGKALGTATSINGTTSFSAQSGTIVVAKIGKESIKISVK